MPESRHTCLHCGGTWVGRKRKFCVDCLPAHSADPDGYMRRYRELSAALRAESSRACSVCEIAFKWRSSSSRCPRCVKAGGKRCRSCSEVFTEPGGRLYCTPCRTRRCGECETAFLPRNSTDVCCSDECRSARDARQRRQQSRRRRIRRRGAIKGPYHDLEVFDRDGWRCGICGGLTLPWKRVPHPKAPTIDHIIPLAAGGDDVAANVQCAHFKCNSMKGPRVMNEQPRLVG